MIFNCFPRKQKGIFLIYSSYNVFKSRLFNDLVIQASPKNSIWFRLLRTNVGFLLASILRYKIQVPSKNHNYIGILKGSNKILFEMIKNKPVYVWRKNESSNWVKEDFLGYQLISEYTAQEFDAKSQLIEKALKAHWASLKESKFVHGDFTHFNILVDINDKIHFIDDKSHINSKLFDFFYFYSYLNERLCRCQTINYIDKEVILEKLGVMIVKVCNYSLESDFFNDVKDINVPEECGLRNEDKQTYILNFQERIISSIKIFNSSVSPNPKRKS